MIWEKVILRISMKRRSSLVLISEKPFAQRKKTDSVCSERHIPDDNTLLFVDARRASLFSSFTVHTYHIG